MTGKITIEQKWHQQSEAAKNEAEKLPQGREREALVRKARQLHTASGPHCTVVVFDLSAMVLNTSGADHRSGEFDSHTVRQTHGQLE